MTTLPPCPECMRLNKVSKESNKIEAFLDWLTLARGISLCTTNTLSIEQEYEYRPCSESIEQLLAKYFDIDMKKVGAERQSLLDYILDQQ